MVKDRCRTDAAAAKSRPEQVRGGMVKCRCRTDAAAAKSRPEQIRGEMVGAW
jgi:hypothetical protein